MDVLKSRQQLEAAVRVLPGRGRISWVSDYWYPEAWLMIWRKNRTIVCWTSFEESLNCWRFLFCLSTIANSPHEALFLRPRFIIFRKAEDKGQCDGCLISPLYCSIFQFYLFEGKPQGYKSQRQKVTVKVSNMDELTFESVCIKFHKV